MGFEGGDGIGMEDGAGISIEGDGDIEQVDDGNIILNSGQLLAGPGTSSVPSISFAGDPDTGLANLFGNQITAINGGTRTWNWSAAQFNSQFSNGPALINAAAGSAAINIRVDRSDSGTGFSTDSQILGLHAANNLIATVDGPADAFVLQGANGLITTGGGGSGPAVLNVGASASVPVFIPNQADPDTGLTRDTINGLSMVAGGLGCIRARAIGGARAVGFYTTTPIIQQTGVAVSAAGIHAACVALGLFTA